MSDVQPPAHTRPTPAGRRSRDDVVEAALALLQDRGLPGLTMRRLAESLDIRPSALYWHVADKQSLLAAVSARILAPAAPSPTLPTATAGTPSSIPGDITDEGARVTTWEATVRSAARDLREALLAVRDGAEVVSSSLALGLVDLPLADRTTPALIEAGAGARTAATVASTLGHFVLGHAFDEQQRRAATEAGVLAPTGARVGADPIATTPEETFTDGVDLVVAGAAVLLAMDRGETPD